VLVTGGAHEQDLAARVAGGRRGLQGADARKTGARDLSGRLTLGQLADVVAGAELVVSGDTGVAHLATAYAVPSVVLFGPTPPWTWGPAIDAHLHVVLWHGDDRPGAHHQGDAHGAALDPALAATTVDEVLESVDRLLTRS